MQLEDKPEFEALLAQMCVGLGVPPTKPRQDAFWSGLRRMTLPQFRRCVEEGLGEKGIEAPTTKAVWQFHRGTQSQPQQSDSPQRDTEPDHLEYFANRLMLQHLMSRHGLGSTATFIPGSSLSMQDAKAAKELDAATAAKRRLVEEFTAYVQDGDDLATPANFIRAWLSIMKRVSPLTEQTIAMLREGMTHPGMETPFGAHMARDIGIRKAKEFEGSAA